MLMCQLAFCLSQFYLVAGYLKMKLSKRQVASIECICRGFTTNRFLPLPTRHSPLYPTIYVILGRACRSDVYSVLRTKAAHEPLNIVLVHAPDSTMCLATIRGVHEQCKPGTLSPPSPPQLGMRVSVCMCKLMCMCVCVCVCWVQLITHSLG